MRSLVAEWSPHSHREKTAAKLRGRMIKSCSEPGEQLAERFCATTGVSGTVLREAFRQLDSEGEVESRKGGGVFVRALTVQDVFDIYELRRALDSEAVGHFLDEQRRKIVLGYGELLNSGSV